MGLASTQTLGGILDGLMRNTPEALEFIDTAGTEGVRAAVERRDGPWGDYSQAPPDDAGPVARHRAVTRSRRRRPPSIDTITPNTTSTPPAASVRFSH